MRISIQPPLSTSGDAEWSVDNHSWLSEIATIGSNMALSGKIGNNSNSDLQLDVNLPKAGILTFTAYINSEYNGDFLLWYLDSGDPIEGISGFGGPITFSFEIPAGVHKIVWRYKKNLLISLGDDLAGVDNILLTNYQESSRLAKQTLPNTVKLWSEHLADDSK